MLHCRITKYSNFAFSFLRFNNNLKQARKAASLSNKHQNKMLREFSIHAFDGKNQLTELANSCYPAIDLLEHLASSARTARRIVDRFAKYLRGPVLEVGGGLGQISNELVNAGLSVSVLEPDQALFEDLSKRFTDFSPIEVMRGTVGTFKEATRYGSAIYINVLEHIADDVDELRRVSKFLVPDGLVVIFSPALPSLYGTMDGLSGHFRRYTKKELISKLQSSGFQLVHVEYFDPVGVLPYFLAYRVLKIRTIGGGGMFLYDNIILPISTVLERLTRGRLIGKNLLIVGQKIRDESK